MEDRIKESNIERTTLEVKQKVRQQYLDAGKDQSLTVRETLGLRDKTPPPVFVPESVRVS